MRLFNGEPSRSNRCRGVGVVLVHELDDKSFLAEDRFVNSFAPGRGLQPEMFRISSRGNFLYHRLVLIDLEVPIKVSWGHLGRQGRGNSCFNLFDYFLDRGLAGHGQRLKPVGHVSDRL